MGLSSSKSKTSSRSNTVQTPNVPSWIQQPYQGFAGQLNTLAQNPTGGTVIGPNANQSAAWAGGAGLSNSNNAILDAIGGTRGLMGYTPTNVEAGQLASTDLSPYMNPYLSNVADTTMQGLERARAGAITSGQGNATLSGAFGGSRHGVADAETNRGFMDTAAATLANLYAGGFQNAQGAALSDIGNRLNADQFNVNSGLQGANFNLNAANQLGSLGMGQDANTRANLGTQADLGQQQADAARANDPNEARMRELAQIAALLSTLQGYPVGQTVNSTSSGTQTSTPSGISQIGTALQTAGSIASLFPSDRRLKRDIELIGPDEKGLNWYRFAYLWDEPGAEPRVGVMADEAPAHAVVHHPAGFDMVRYDLL